MTKKKLTRREREKLRHRKEILDSACEVFAEKGFRRSTIQDISQRSEFSIASIYKHFQSKEDIYHSLIEQVLSVFLKTLKKSTQNLSDPLEKLYRSVETTLKMYEEKRAFCQFLFGELRPMIDEEAEQLSMKSLNAYLQIVAYFQCLFTEAIEKKSVIDVPPIYLTISLLGNLYAFMNYWLHLAGREIVEDLEPILGKEDYKVIPKVFFEAIALKPIKK